MDDLLESTTIPKWLNREDFFLSILERELNLNRNEFTLKITSISPAVGTGKYSSDLHRVNIEVTLHDDSNETIKSSTIIKSLAQEQFDIYKNDSDVMDIFDKESIMYVKIIPLLVQQWLNTGTTIKFSPKCYDYLLSPTKVLIIEDLKALNYKMGNRFEGLDLDHARVFLKKLAQFHASSAVGYEKHEEFGDSYHDGLFNERLIDSFNDWMDSHYKYFIEAIQYHEFSQDYVGKLTKWKQNAFKELCRVTTPDPNIFNVLNHGDCWINNIFFAYDDNGHPQDALMIDFQASFFASPAIDLFHFFMSSTSNKVKQQHFNKLIKYYHDNLVKALVKLKYKKPIITLKELHMQLLDRGFYGAFDIMGIVAVSQYDPNDNFIVDFHDPKTVCEKVMTKRRLYNNPRYLKKLAILLPFLDELGLLDV